MAAGIPQFHRLYPDIKVRLRLSDHNVDILKERIDLAFRLGVLEDSSLRMRNIMECERVLCAAPSYLAEHGVPDSPDDLAKGNHNCLLVRFPGSSEFAWTLQMPDGVHKVDVSGAFDSDDGEVLLEWALGGYGIVNRPRFEVHNHLNSGRLMEILKETPPVPAQLAVLYPHKDFEDPKLRLFIEFMTNLCQKQIREALA